MNVVWINEVQFEMFMKICHFEMLGGLFCFWTLDLIHSSSDLKDLKSWHSQFPCLTISIKWLVWKTSRQVRLLCPWTLTELRLRLGGLTCSKRWQLNSKTEKVPSLSSGRGT